MPLHDYAGCLHIHSTMSDGDVAPPQIIAAAREAGLRYVVFSEHPPLREDHGQLAGWHDGVLVALGAELKTGGQHCMALGMDGATLRGLREREDAAAGIERLARIRQGGGLVFVAHPKTVRKPLFHVAPPGWHDWDVDAFDGIEIWPYMHDWIRDLRLRNFLSHYRHPDRWITGPEPDVLRHWDEVGRRRRCVGIGALDNHARRLPFRRWGPPLLEIFPHRYVFRTIRTHVLSPEPFTNDAPADLATLRELLRAGRCYVSYDLLADATGFRFEAEREAQTFQMGDEVPAASAIEFRASLPVEADVRLLRDGQPLASTTGRELTASAAEPGVYRIEARLEGRPWLYSNPIYVR